MSLKYTRAILDAIHNDDLTKVEFDVFPVFNMLIPKTCPNVPTEILNPKNTWADKVFISLFLNVHIHIYLYLNYKK